MLQITFQTEQNGVLGRLHRELDGTSTAVDSVLQTATDEWLAFLTVSGIDAPPDVTIEPISTVDLLRWRAYTEDSETFILLVQIADDSCIVQTVAERQAIPNAVRFRNRNLQCTVTVEDWDHLQTIANDIEAEHDKFDLVSVNQVDHMDSVLGSDRFKQATLQELPSEHLRTLEVAFRAGYFDVPQSTTATEVADELGVSQSTFSERVRRAVSALLDVLFGDQPTTSESEAAKR